MTQQKEHFKYKIIAHIVRLHLNKNLNFQTKIAWKRNVNKTQTRTVTHQGCESLFDQTLELELNLVHNTQNSQFQSKLTEFGVVVIYQGKIKSGGSVRYNVADIVNNNFNNQTVKLSLDQCPDSSAFLQVIFDYEIVGDTSRSLFNELRYNSPLPSMLNPSGFEQDLSQIDFREDEKETSRQVINIQKEIQESEKENIEDMPLRVKEVSKINNILDKFQSVSRRLSSNQKNVCGEDQNSTKLSNCQISSIPTDQQLKLQSRVSELQSEVELKNAIIDDYQKKLQTANRSIEELQLKLELTVEKLGEMESKSHLGKVDQALAQSEKNYRGLYQKTLQEFQQLKASNSNDVHFSQLGHFNKIIEQVSAIDEIPQFQMQAGNHQTAHLNEMVGQLQRQNIELQTKIASSTHNIAQLFNAAYDYGGAKLLDYLQNSIGLIEQEQ